MEIPFLPFDIEPTRAMDYEHLARVEGANLPLVTYEQFMAQIDYGDETEDHF